jgi:hypothetical protein
MTRCNADGVLGPVLPDFAPEAPEWLRRGAVYQRRRHATGTPIDAGDARTGNVLLRRALFPDGELWFDPAYGRSGGEDSEFFARQFALGRRFVWCDEAEAYEEIPSERWKVSSTCAVCGAPERSTASGCGKGGCLRRRASARTS